jgi:outer membrane protein TolC
MLAHPRFLSVLLSVGVWAGFGDPQLTRFVGLALEQNLDLAQASARVAQARAGLEAADAALMPSGSCPPTGANARGVAFLDQSTLRQGLAAELQVRQAEGALAQVRASVPALEMG